MDLFSLASSAVGSHYRVNWLEDHYFYALSCSWTNRQSFNIKKKKNLKVFLTRLGREFSYTTGDR